MSFEMEVNFPARIVVRSSAARAVGLELSAVGAEKVVFVIDDIVSAGVANRVAASLETARLKWGVLAVHPEGYEIGKVDRTARWLRDAEGVVAFGSWPAIALSKVLSWRLNAALVAVPMPPGFAEAFSRKTVPPRGFIGRFEPLKLPSSIIVDPELVIRDKLTGEEVRSSLVLEVLTVSLEALAVGWRNDFAVLLAATAVEELERSARFAQDDRSVERLLRAAVYASIAREHAGGSALSSLARAMHALFGVCPYKAELALVKPWAKAAWRSVQGLPLSNAYRRALCLLEEFTSGFSTLPILPDLGLQESKLDLIVEYAWTFEHYSLERDPAVSSRFSLRRLLAEAS